ncbi:HTH-type transcriptional regulator ArgP [wastewater metagenome]|uniref:HTH-type transcriptional regulator ArgP n=2 Tax=unclassified sequences TaxID=12908 RepID=A0A5B8RAT1_9ZZZZ|nr:LysR substrate-binding domain-containing protein [Arhodomonas sp. KWT]QEA05880.1 HTH-type transcriptional regulator ArgP [uncultured organism]
MKDLDIDLLRVFVAIAEEGSFTGAGQRLYRTQSTISLQLKRLEQRVGHRLVRRTQGRVGGLTALGETLLGYARELIRLHGEATAALGTPRLTGMVRLGLSDEAAHQDLSQALARFQARHPRVQLEVTCSASDELEEHVATGRLDLALINRCDNDVPAELELDRLYREELVWVMHEGLQWLPDEPVPLVCFPQGCAYRARAIGALDRQHLRWRPVYTSASREGVWSAVVSGLGVAALPMRGIAPESSKVITAAATGLPPLPPVTVALVVATEHKTQEPLASLSSHVRQQFVRHGVSRHTPEADGVS